MANFEFKFGFEAFKFNALVFDLEPVFCRRLFPALLTPLFFISTPLWQPRTDAASRLLGLGFAAAGAGILYWQMVITLQRAAVNNPEIMYSLKLIALGEMFAVRGLYWIASGLAGYAKLIGLQRDHRFLVGLGVIAFIAICITDHFMTLELSKYGYAL